MTTLDDTPTPPPEGTPTPTEGPPAAPGDGGDEPARRLEVRESQRRARTERRAGRVAAALSGTGRVLITAGLLVLGFVAFQLWGTNLLNAREQRELRDEFTDQLEQAGLALPDGVPTEAELDAVADQATTTTDPAPATTSTTSDAPTPTTTTVAAPPVDLAPELGEAVAALQIPAIGVEQFVVQGVTRDDLRKGPGHYPSTPLPGQPGNAAIAGHRTTHGAPFNQLDELEPGDPIVVTTLHGIYTYRVTETTVVDPSDISVLDPVDGADTLTLTTCHPEFSARERLVVLAELVPEESSALHVPGEPVAEEPPTELPGDELPGDGSGDGSGDDATAATADDGTTATTAGTVPSGPSDPVLDHDVETVEDLEAFSAPGTAFYLWALVVIAVGGAWWWAFRRWRRVWTWFAGVVPFLVVLFLLYVQVELVLPAGY